jgi:hypothetical protein
MSCMKRLPSGGLVFLDCHIRVTKPHNLDLTPAFDINGTLLGAARSSKRFVKSYFSSVFCSHITSFQGSTSSSSSGSSGSFLAAVALWLTAGATFFTFLWGWLILLFALFKVLELIECIGIHN